MLAKKFTVFLALVSAAWAVPIRREVPQEHSHEQFLTTVNEFLKLDNPDGIVDAVFALLGNAAAQQGIGKIADATCLQLATADRAFTNAKAAGSVEGQVAALIYRALERNTGSVGLASDLCESIQAVNPEIAAIQQHQDPASDNAAEINKAITLELAKQIQAVGGNPLDALKAGTFAPGEIGDPTAKGNSCNEIDDPVGCIFTQNLLVPDASEDEILAAVGEEANAENNEEATATATATNAATQTVTVTQTVVVTATAGVNQNKNKNKQKNKAVFSSSQNYQKYTGQLGGILAPPVISGVHGFLVNNNVVNDLALALQQSCAIQQDLCLQLAGLGGQTFGAQHRTLTPLNLPLPFFDGGSSFVSFISLALCRILYVFLTIGLPLANWKTPGLPADRTNARTEFAGYLIRSQWTGGVGGCNRRTFPCRVMSSFVIIASPDRAGGTHLDSDSATVTLQVRSGWHPACTASHHKHGAADSNLLINRRVVPCDIAARRSSIWRQSNVQSYSRIMSAISSNAVACAQTVICDGVGRLSSLSDNWLLRPTMGKLFSLFCLSTASLSVVHSATVAEIQGPAWQSPLAGQTVHNLTGTASTGFYIVGEKSDDVRVSNGLYIYSTSSTVLNSVSVGDAISLSGKVSEFRSSSNPNYLYLTELTSPTDIHVVSSGNTVTPVVLGKDRIPPTQLLSALDTGADGFLSVPNNISRIEQVNATLQPDKYGLDFWESLEGQLVTIPKPTTLGFANNYGEFWVHGDWPVTGKNNRGGLTINIGQGGIPDGNPEAIMIGSPLDGTKNPAPSLGAVFTDIKGIVTYQFGFYYVLPLTAPSVVSRPDPTVPATTLSARKLPDACTITFGDYNVENLAPTSKHLPTVASHIVTLLKTPDFLFLQEIQDDSGPKDDGTVSANLTLSTLTKAIYDLSSVSYAFASVDPVDGQDGGQPGGNIRTAFLYRWSSAFGHYSWR
ncbi:hypothetical protein NMY22_g8024 [Coprinellus aureogranulatus]|nr:hypothetical protein NMY22_g8024 [Coprinellus aureogranulatus]